jgi:cobalt/nickel transport system permease protein
VNQLSFTYRYLFVLADEAVRMVRAHALRSPDRPQPALRVAGSLLGLLLLRTLDRARRVHAAMLCRGFDGELRRLERARLRGRDLAFAAIWCGFFALARTYDLPRLLGALVTSSG